MKRKKTVPLITCSQRMLNFANLPIGEVADKCEEKLRPDGVRDEDWNRLLTDDFHGIASLNDLQDLTQQRLGTLISGATKTQNKLLAELVDELPSASEPAIIRGIVIPLPCVPRIILANGRVAIRNEWLVTGAHNALTFGLLELFVDSLVEKLARCRNCKKFFLVAPTLKSACSVECRRKLRNKAVAKNVKRCRREHRRKRRRQQGKLG